MCAQRWIFFNFISNSRDNLIWVTQSSPTTADITGVSVCERNISTIWYIFLVIMSSEFFPTAKFKFTYYVWAYQLYFFLRVTSDGLLIKVWFSLLRHFKNQTLIGSVISTLQFDQHLNQLTLECFEWANVISRCDGWLIINLIINNG